MIPRATYRFQFQKSFPFAEAARLVPYLHRLGISHVYASPITTARKGSAHGYDVTDPTRINPELGGEEGLRALVAELRRHDMGLIIDIVPNHMGIANSENAWWNDVLQNGQNSAYAHFFDIDWQHKLVWPVLNENVEMALAEGKLVRHGQVLRYAEHTIPLRPDIDMPDLAALVEAQHYRLVHWRAANDELNWRRFFLVCELAGMRVEDEDVFETTHKLYFDLYADGLIDGVRIDHIDGLTDPALYCRKLRQRFDALERPASAPQGKAYIVVEKILAEDETLPADWGLQGTSGYDFMAKLNALLHVPTGTHVLDRLWLERSDRDGDFAAEELQSRRDVVAWQFTGQLRSCANAFHALAARQGQSFTPDMLERAIERLLWVFPVYRTYGTGVDAPVSDKAVRETVQARVAPYMPPAEMGVGEWVLDCLGGAGKAHPDLAREAVRRFQQLSVPVAAKAVEDTAFYRYGRLLSANEVGANPGHIGCATADFHAAMLHRFKTFPHGMLATATHDHKRGEDVRMRLALLSELPDMWRETVSRWEELIAPVTKNIHPADRYMILQQLFGAWPENLPADDRQGLNDYAQRLCGWCTKALKEAKLRSSWDDPDEGYEAMCEDVIIALLNPASSAAFLADVTAFTAYLDAPLRANMLVQTALRCTLPGVPDLYQGTELADFSLVDPDNRRPVDYAMLQAVADGRYQGNIYRGKMDMLKTLLPLRRQYPHLFSHGDYRPLAVTGPASAHILAFKRQHGDHCLKVAVALHCAQVTAGSQNLTPPAAWWENTAIEGQAAATLFAHGPVYVTVDEQPV